MAHISLNGNTREVTGNQVRKLRKQGIIPAVIYGKNFQSINVQVDYKTFFRVYKNAGKTTVVDFTIEETKKTIPCLIQDIDFEPVYEKFRHIDFLAVDLKITVKATVPINFVGQSKAIKELGAILITVINEIEVEALPDSIPHTIEVDISKLETLDDTIRVSDIQATNYVILDDPENAIATLSVEDNTVEDIQTEVVQTEVMTGEAKAENTKSE
jgi:large subunit ribosomal protein L25